MMGGIRTFREKTNKEFDYIARTTYHEVPDWMQGFGLSVWSRSMYGKDDWFSAISMKNEEFFPSGWFKTREGALNEAILEAMRLYVIK